MRGRRGSRSIVTVLVLLAAGSLAALAVLNWRHRNDRIVALEEYRAAALEAVDSAADRIEARLDELRAVEALAAELGAGAAEPPDALERRLRQVLESNSAISSIALAFPAPRAPAFFPDAGGEEVAVFLAVVRRESSGLELAHYSAAQAADTSRGDITAWYREPLARGAGVWNDEPFYSPLSRRWFSGGYGVPFAYPSPEGPIETVVYADLSLARVQRELYLALSREMAAFPLEASYAFLLSDSGYFLSHPDGRFVEGRKRLTDFDPDLGADSALGALPLLETDDGRAVHLEDDHRDPTSGRVDWVFFSRLGASHWWLGIALDKAEAFRRSRTADGLARDSTRELIAWLAALALVAALALRVERGDEWRLWGLAITVSALAVAGIGILWSMHLGSDADQNLQDIVIYNAAVPHKIELGYLDARGEELILVPTGVYVQSIEFSSANNVTVTGYVWQRFAPDLPAWAVPAEDEAGFVLPESESTEISRAYEREDGRGRLIGWTFKAVLRQEFDYSHYPFDSEVVWIRLWPSALGRNVALSPDLASYDTLDPAAVPGVETVEQGFVLEGWRLARSYFSYRLNSYSTSFGLGAENASRRSFPELYFNVGLERIFLNPFIGNFIPLAVVAFLLFGVLWTVRTAPESAQLLGFNSAAVLGFCAALFFVVIVAHTSLRESLAAQRIVYLEYFYFVLYVAILGVAVNSIQIASPSAWRWLRHGDNLAARLLFWPLVTLSLLWITVVAFG